LRILRSVLLIDDEFSRNRVYKFDRYWVIFLD
jgi:hypothetical protein